MISSSSTSSSALVPGNRPKYRPLQAVTACSHAAWSFTRTSWLIIYWLKQFVSRVLFPGRVTLPWAVAIHLGLPLPAASSSQPGGTGGTPLTPPYLALLLAGFTWHPPSPTDPVSSYLTLSPLPAEAGGLLSVALIPGIAPAGRYPAPYPVEPGLSSLRKKSGHLSCFSQSLGTVSFRPCCVSLRRHLCGVP